MNNTTEIVLRKEDFIENEGMLWMPIRELARWIGYKNPRRLGALLKNTATR
jgi:hypothetical protein